MAQPLSPRSVRYTHTIVGRAFADVVEWGLLPRNPARTAKPPRVVTSDMAVWDAVQARQFLAFVRDGRLYAMWLLMLTTAGAARSQGFAGATSTSIPPFSRFSPPECP